jgi:hypothetical protein
MDNVQNCDSYINILSSENYRCYSGRIFGWQSGISEQNITFSLGTNKKPSKKPAEAESNLFLLLLVSCLACSSAPKMEEKCSFPNYTPY